MRSDYDVIVIGGGINGAGITLDLASRGLNVCCLEKNSFGSGCSSNSSKLIHGGLRYLEHGHFGLVKEALKEQSILLNIAPKYVQPLSFLLPSYKGLGKAAWQLKIGLTLYDMLFKRSLAKHQSFSKTEAKGIFGDFGLRTSNLHKGFQFEDALMDDWGLVQAIIRKAQYLGASCYQNTKVTTIETIKAIKTVRVQSKVGSLKTLTCKTVVHSSGAWFSELYHGHRIKVMPSKGVHLLLALPAKEKAMLMFHPVDARVVFLIPYQGYSLLGTTDSPYTGALDKLSVTDSETQYLFEVLDDYFPTLGDASKKIIKHFVGIRPLIASKNKAIGSLSREYKVFQEPEGIFHVLGGKYSTYRALSEHVSNQVVSYLGLPAKDYPCQSQGLMID